VHVQPRGQEFSESGGFSNLSDTSREPVGLKEVVGGFDGNDDGTFDGNEEGTILGRDDG